MRSFVTALVLVLGIAPAPAATIAPHRAVYDLTLSRAGSGADIAAVEGRLAYEVQGTACEGWTVSFRMANRFAPVEGEVRTIDMQSTSFESGDFLGMRYSGKEYVNGALTSESRIKAERAALGRDGTASTEGKPEPISIPSEALFPMQHQLRLIDLAQKGEGRDTSVLYDASDEGKVFRVITFIGTRKEPGANSRDKTNPDAAALAGLASWPVSVSYYPIEGTEDIPDYQIAFDLYENGVATGLLLDYGQFALSGTLKKLETLGSGDCN